MARRIVPHAPFVAFAATPLAMGEIVVDETSGDLRFGNGYTPGGVGTGLGAEFAPDLPGAKPRKLGLKVGEFVSVMDFGAIGDGIADDTLWIQRALDSSWSDILFPVGDYRVTSELRIPSNKRLFGRGHVFTPDVAGAAYANSVFTSFDQANITIDGLQITGPRGGRSGTWTPVGTLDGVGSCILLAGCDNILIINTVTKYGGDPYSSAGVGNIYTSSCSSVIIASNFVSHCDNGIVNDQWYSKLAGKESKFTRALVITGNVVHDCAGRAIAAEFLDNDLGGECTITGNAIFNALNAGIQIRRARSGVITGNVINLANVNRIAEISDNRNGLYGIDGSNCRRDLIISDNTIINPRWYGARLYNASGLVFHDNIIRYDSLHGVNTLEMFSGILVQNTDTDFENISIHHNQITGGTGTDGTTSIASIQVSKAGIFTGTSKAVRIEGNDLRPSAGRAVFCNVPLDIKIHGNAIRFATNYGGSIGVDVRDSMAPSVSGNSIYNVSTGINFAGNSNPQSSQNQLENCTNPVTLSLNVGGASSDFIRGGSTAFNFPDYGAGAAFDATKATLIGVATAKSTANRSVRVRTSGLTVPAAGNWGQGDVVENVQPAGPGSAALWICTASGSPGTWGAVNLA